jgi:hypothetical protein
LKLMNALLVTALVLFTMGVAHADDFSGGDSRIVIGGGGPGSPSCTGYQELANSDGTLSADCTVDPNTVATSITFAVPSNEVLGGALTCNSVLTSINWTATSSTVGGVDECTFTAPSDPNGELRYLLFNPAGRAAYFYAITHDPGGFNLDFNDGDCDLDDFLVGIPGGNEGGNGSVGCDITFSTIAGATIDNTEALTSDAIYDVSPTGPGGLVPFPEPGTLALLLIGLAPLGFLRRREAQR